MTNFFHWVNVYNIPNFQLKWTKHYGDTTIAVWSFLTKNNAEKYDEISKIFQKILNFANLYIFVLILTMLTRKKIFHPQKVQRGTPWLFF